jgi:hypothetical protein
LVGKYTLKSDVYSYGIVSIIMLYDMWHDLMSLYKVVIETFTGLKAYDDSRGDDACLVCL